MCVYSRIDASVVCEYIYREREGGTNEPIRPVVQSRRCEILIFYAALIIDILRHRERKRVCVCVCV